MSDTKVQDTVPDTTKHIALEKAVEFFMDRGDGSPDVVIEAARKFEVWLREPNQSTVIPIGPVIEPGG